MFDDTVSRILLGVLISIVGWLFVTVYNKLDKIISNQSLIMQDNASRSVDIKNLRDKTDDHEIRLRIMERKI